MLPALKRKGRSLLLSWQLLYLATVEFVLVCAVSGYILPVPSYIIFLLLLLLLPCPLLSSLHLFHACSYLLASPTPTLSPHAAAIIRAVNPHDRQTALHRAAHAGQTDNVILLLKADPECANAQDRNGDTAIHLACQRTQRKQYRRTVEALLVGGGRERGGRGVRGRQGARKGGWRVNKGGQKAS